MRLEAKTAMTIRRSQPIFILLSWEIKGTFMLYGSSSGDVTGVERYQKSGMLSNRNNRQSCGVLYSDLDADFFLSHTILTRAKKLKILTGNLLLSVKIPLTFPSS